MADGRGLAAMTTHDLYVTAAYAISLMAIVGLILIDQRARKREMADLEANGIRRRSDKGGTAHGA